MNTILRLNIDELSFEIRGTLRLIVPQAAQAWGAIYKTLYETCLIDFVNCLEMAQNKGVKMTFLIFVVFSSGF